MDELHRGILEIIKSHAVRPGVQEINQRYHGNTHYYYGLPVPIKRTLVKQFLKNHPDITALRLTQLVTSLMEGHSYEEKTFGGHLIETAAFLRMDIDPEVVIGWLDHLVGWAEVDTLCQSSYSASEILSNWSIWQNLLIKCNLDPNIQKRRASLVLLIKAIGQSGDPRLADLAFANIHRLQSEKEILIIKAISWLLRTLSKNHRARVEEYLQNNRELLPKIAVRETEMKLKHGIKNYRGV